MADTTKATLRERFSEMVATMSPRDRGLFIGLVSFGFLSVLGGGWWLGSSMVGDVQSRIDAREETLSQLRSLAVQQAAAAEQVDEIEADLRKSAGQDLPSFVEKKAADEGIGSNLQGVREKQITTEGTLEERTYAVEVSKITLEQLTGFLHALETGGYPLRVRSTKVKAVTQAGQKLLNVSMEVSAFRLAEDGAAPEGGADGKEESP